MGFNKEEFANLLEKAKGHRSINKYAADIDISPAHISRLLRKLLETPPSPETIAKFAQEAYNGVTYDDFMLAAGHIGAYEKSEETGSRHQISAKKFHQALMPYLFTLGTIKSINPPSKEPELFDLTIELKEDTYSKWYFRFHPSMKESDLFVLLGQLTLYPFNIDEKITIAATNEEDYRLLLKNKPQSLRANLYAMLIDLDSLEIVKEEVLCRV